MTTDIQVTTCPVCGSGSDHTTDLEVIRHDIAELKAAVDGLTGVVVPIISEVMPYVEEVANGPMGKMLGIKGGN